jgi:DnaJ-domain-containing protein 1
MDSSDWTKRWGGSRQSTRDGAWTDRTQENANAQSKAHGFKGRAGAGGSWGGESSYYSVLGLAPGADAKAIKAAYRKLAKRYHPDRFMKAHPEAQAKAEDRMKAINAAYDALKPRRRAAA